MKSRSIFTLLFVFALYSCNDFADSPDGNFTNGYYNLDGFSGSDMPQAGDQYAEIEENPFIEVADQPVSTFSIDADGASYSNVRRFIMQDRVLPPSGAVRTEELINYFDLDYDFNSSEHPISLNGEVSECPWSEGHKLIRIGIKGQPIPEAQMPASNFVFLIDVSGSMGSEDKLATLKEGFKYLVDELTENDRIAIVTYAGSAGLLLNSTSGSEKQKIKGAINQLGAGGSTAGAQGIVTAYEIAQEHLIEGGNNRIILGTDGDFNVGISDRDELVSLIEKKRELGIFLTVLGVGRGNLNDAMHEQIANNGNGTYEYIDCIEQLKKVFIYEKSKFYTVAKDVKVQVEFSSVNVQAYRLIGYENRLLDEEDFEDDKKDAGEIGADQNITALYEIIPGSNPALRSVPTFTIDFRYKLPDQDNSKAMSLEIFDDSRSFANSTNHMQFVSAVASYSMTLRDSPYKGDSGYEKILAWLENIQIPDDHGFKQEFKSLVESSITISK